MQTRTFNILYAQYSGGITKKEYTTENRGRSMLFVFHEHAVCERGSKLGEKAYLTSVSNIAMWFYYAWQGQRQYFHYSESPPGVMAKVLDCSHVMFDMPLNEETKLISAV